MATNKWGPSTWKFLHTFVAKIKEDKFEQLFPQIYTLIIRICMYLPCPDCSSHAKQYLNRIDSKKIKVKQDLINLFYHMHNTVNSRVGKPSFNHKNMDYYKTLNLIQVYNDFSRNFNTHGNMNLIADSMHRKMIQKDLRQWLMLHYQFFEH